MKKTAPTFLLLASFFVLTLPAQAETLGNVLREAGWEKIVGAWGDAETKGEKLKVTYAWKFKDTVLSVETKSGKRESTALIAMRGGKVVHATADNLGGAGMGQWDDKETGEVVLTLEYTSADGTESEIRTSQQLVDDNTLKVTMAGNDGEAKSLALVRLK